LLEIIARKNMMLMLWQVSPSRRSDQYSTREHDNSRIGDAVLMQSYYQKPDAAHGFVEVGFDSAVTLNSCLGNKSGIFQDNNENNQLKRQVWPSQRYFLDTQLWTRAHHLSSRVVAVTTTIEIVQRIS